MLDELFQAAKRYGNKFILNVNLAYALSGQI